MKTKSFILTFLSIVVVFFSTANFASADSSRRLPVAYTVHTYGEGKTFQQLSDWETLTSVNLSSVTTTDQPSSGNTLYLTSTTLFDTCQLNESTIEVAGQILAITGINSGDSLTVSNISGTIPSGTAVKTGFVLTAYQKSDNTAYNDSVSISGATTDANFFRVIRAADGQRGTKNSGVRFIFTTASDTGVFLSYENYFSIYDIAARNTLTNSNVFVFFILGNYSQIIGCTAFDTASSNGSAIGFYSMVSSGYANYIKFVNCLADNIDSYISGWGGFSVYQYRSQTNYTYFYNCTAINCLRSGFFLHGENLYNPSGIAKNCISQSNGTSFGVYASPYGNWTQISNVTSSVTFAADGYHLSSSDTVAKDHGTDLSTDANFPFNDDIDRQTRPFGSVWDIGADEYYPDYTLSYGSGANGFIIGTNPQTVSYGGNGTQVTAVPNTGYHFLNWSDGSTQNPRTDTNVTANISVTANFEINTYTVTFDKNGGDTEPDPTIKTTTYNTKIDSLPLPPTRAGYTFKGWNTNIDGSGTFFTSLTLVTQNLTVYAQWV